MESVMHSDIPDLLISAERMTAYERDGYLVMPHLFADDEIEFLKTTAERELPAAQVLTKEDQAGNKISLKMWGHTGDDVYGLFSRNERIVQAVQRFVGDEVYLYSAKMILKNARDGG